MPYTEHRQGGNHGWFGSRLEPIGRAAGVEVGRGTGDNGQRTTTVKCVGDVNRHFLLGVQELIVMKECECTDAGQQ